MGWSPEPGSPDLGPVLVGGGEVLGAAPLSVPADGEAP